MQSKHIVGWHMTSSKGKLCKLRAISLKFCYDMQNFMFCLAIKSQGSWLSDWGSKSQTYLNIFYFIVWKMGRMAKKNQVEKIQKTKTRTMQSKQIVGWHMTSSKGKLCKLRTIRSLKFCYDLQNCMFCFPIKVQGSWLSSWGCKSQTSLNIFYCIIWKMGWMALSCPLTRLPRHKPIQIFLISRGHNFELLMKF